jgi:diguanylate cyclase
MSPIAHGVSLYVRACGRVNYVDLPLGLALAALTGVAVAVPAMWVLLRRGLAAKGAAGRVTGLAAGALACIGVTMAVVWFATLWWEPGWSADGAAHVRLGMLAGTPASVTALLLLAALFELADRVVGLGARVHLLIEALTVAMAIFMAYWTLGLGRGGWRAPPASIGCLPVLVAVGAACLVLGLCVVLLMRADVRGRELPALLAGVGLTAAGAAGVAGGLCYGLTPVVVGGALVIGLGGALCLTRPVPEARSTDERPVSPHSGLATGLLPIIAVALAASWSFSGGLAHLDLVTILIGCSTGVLLVIRQYLAFAEVRWANARLAQSELHYRDLAHTDPLTGLANRRGLLRALYLDAATGVPCVLVTLDLDGFKNVNDMRGHDVGDTVLIEVAQRLKLNLRAGDVAARLGGDEFAVLMWGQRAEATSAAHRLLALLSRPYQVSGGTIFLSTSIGLAPCLGSQHITTVLRNADLALRAAKQHGKNRVEEYDEVYDLANRKRNMIEQELRSAIERDELTLVYQPVVALPSVRPVGAEALLRWNHPQLGAVSPGDFIPIAEETGQIEMLGSWVLLRACQQLSRWVAAGHDVWVSVNVSPRELHSATYVARVKEVLRANRVPPARLVLEVTEHAVATDVSEFRRTLSSLRSLGVRIALDDFGAGYSSLGQLRTMPVDILKIDHSLVADPVSDRGHAAPMVDVVVRLGQRLGLQVIAEGMCEPHHRRTVEAAGCPYGQGFLFGMGVPPEHLEAMLVAVPSTSVQPRLGTQRSAPPPALPARLAATAPPASLASKGDRRDTGIPTSGSS